MANYDSAQALYNWLKESTDTVPVAIRALTINGATGIVETASLSTKFFSDQEQARRTAATPDKVLAIAVQDAGEEPVERGSYEQLIVVRIVDRQAGLTNIRAVRQLLRKSMRNRPISIDPGVNADGLTKIVYRSRTGHLRDVTTAIDYEAVVFVATVASQEN